MYNIVYSIPKTAIQKSMITYSFVKALYEIDS